MSTKYRFLLATSTAAAVSLLAGCASVADVKPGTPYKQVVDQFGNPAVSCPESGGGTRMIWTQEPSGEQAWATNVGANKLVGPFSQVLTKSAFEQLNQGQWTAGTVRCAFGPPATMKVFPDNQNQIVWEYHYLGSGVNYDMLYVTFDRATNNMVSYTTSMDPDRNPLLMGGGR